MIEKFTAGQILIVVDASFCNALIYEDQWVTFDRYHPDGKRLFIRGTSEALLVSRFKSIESTNGVDKDGTPLNFTNSDFKPFQRVVLKTGKTYIVVNPDAKGNARACSDSGWVEIDLKRHDKDFCPCAVYEAPSFAQFAFDTDVMGELIWKAVDEKSPAQIAKEGRLKQITELAETVQKAQEQIEALKKEV